MNWSNLWVASYETLLMTIISTILAYLVGLPLGILLYMTSKNGICKNKFINIPLGIIVNIMRSIPCLLLIILLMPLTRSIFGTGSGKWFTMIVPLFFSSFAFISRMVESSLNEVDGGVIEMARSMGASNNQIIFKVLLKEAKPSLILGVAISMISILGYTAFAYDLGAGGLIAQAYSFYTRHTMDFYKYPNVWIIIVLIVVIVQLIQEGSILLNKKIDKRRKAK
ncbi:MAG: methionine ABC transporter permease [Bacilli bacterium]